MDEWTGMKDGGPGEGEAARQEQALGGQNASPPGAISGRATGERSEVSHTLRLQQTHLKHFGVAVYRFGKTLKVHFDFDLLKVCSSLMWFTPAAELLLKEAAEGERVEQRRQPPSKSVRPD